MTSRQPVRRSAVLATALIMTLLTAVPAAAHPFIRGGEAPVDTQVSLTLAMAHGCEGDSGAEGSFTTEVALEVPEWLEVVETPPQDGWTIEHETDDEGDVAVVTWTTADPVEAAPEFILDVVATGETGQDRFLKMFQGCGETEHRWVGTPDEPAEEPAVALTLTAEDPERPAPDVDEETSDPAAGDDPAEEPSADAGSDPDLGPETEDAPTEDDPTAGTPSSPTGEPDSDDEADQETPTDTDDELAAEEADDDRGVAWLIGVIAVIVLIAAGILWVKQRSVRSGTTR